MEPYARPGSYLPKYEVLDHLGGITRTRHWYIFHIWGQMPPGPLNYDVHVWVTRIEWTPWQGWGKGIEYNGAGIRSIASSSEEKIEKILQVANCVATWPIPPHFRDYRESNSLQEKAR